MYVVRMNEVKMNVRPMETIVQFVFCEQAPTDKLDNRFRMAELLHTFCHCKNDKMVLS